MRVRPRLALRSPWKLAARWWSTGASWSRRRTAPVSRWKGSEGAGDDRGGRRDPQGRRTARAPSVHRRGSRGVAAAARALAATRKAERVRELHPRREDARALSLGAPARRAHRDPLARPAAAGRPAAGGPGARDAGEGRAQGGIRAGRLSELLVVALEASADLHGAAVLRELKALRPGLRAFGAGGPRMRAAGFEALARAEDVSVMGIAEVLPALPRILETMDALYDAARERRPRAALLSDSPDFNLRLARRLRPIGIPVAYFIGPSVWAWRAYRVRQIARHVARMLVILPFETRFYQAHRVPAIYVGNPLADGVRGVPSPPARALSRGPALLPGRRAQARRRTWPPMLAAARLLKERLPRLRLVVPVAPTTDRALPGPAPAAALVAGRHPDA